MRTTWNTLATLLLTFNFALGIPYAQQSNDPTPSDIEKGRAQLESWICAPDYVPGEIILPDDLITDPNDARRVKSDSLDAPDPREYSYVALPLRSGKQIMKAYLVYVISTLDAVAQSHINFDEAIPREGYNITARGEYVELHVTQAGDHNLVWGNVKNAIAELKRYYSDSAIKSPAYLAEVIVQLGFFLEGYVKMVGTFPCDQSTATA